MRKEEIENVLNAHKLWLNNDGGQRADLSGADLFCEDLSDANLRRADLRGAYLSGANLRRADLRGADLRRANLSGADLSDANLRGAYFSGADLRRADLSGADLRGADLRRADFSGADLSGAVLSDADLRGANLSGADLSGAEFNNETAFFAINCPEKGSFVGFKKIKDKIVELEIPSDARRSSATTRKCRCEFAKVLKITNIDGSDANIDKIENKNYATTVYAVGEMVYPDAWDEDRWNECSHGIHFFITREEAVNY